MRQIQRDHHALHVRLTGNQDRSAVRLLVGKLRQQLCTVHARHAVIGNDAGVVNRIGHLQRVHGRSAYLNTDIGRIQQGHLKQRRFLPHFAEHFIEPVALRQAARDRIGDIDFVINHQNLVHRVDGTMRQLDAAVAQDLCKSPVFHLGLTELHRLTKRTLEKVAAPRLGDKAVDVRLVDHPDQGVEIGFTREHDAHTIRLRGCHGFEQFQTVHIRHAIVGHHHLERLHLHPLQCLKRIGEGLDLIAVAAQRLCR